MLAYVLLLFSISSFDVFETMNWYQRFLIDNRNYPGGPAQYENDFYFVTLNTMCNVSYMLGNWLADGLMVCIFQLVSFRGSLRAM